MNICQVTENVFRFRIWNLLASGLGFDGHFTIWWERKTGKFVLGKHGGYGGLTWYQEEKLKPVVPSKEQVEFLKPIVDKELKYAYFWDYDKKNYHGNFLLEEMRKREEEGEYFGVRGRMVFPADDPLKRLSEEKEKDDDAVRILQEYVEKG